MKFNALEHRYPSARNLIYGRKILGTTMKVHLLRSAGYQTIQISKQRRSHRLYTTALNML